MTALSRRTLFAVTVACLALQAACSMPSRPDSSKDEDPPASAGPAPESSPSKPAPQVAVPWRPGMPQLGVNLFWEEGRDDDEVTRAKARRALDYLIELNVNSVAVNVPLFMDNPGTNTVRADKRYTPSPERLALFLEEAARSKFRVTVRPVLDERLIMKVDPKAWRGNIAPPDRSAWFASYSQLLRPYATVAQKFGVAEFVVGVELNSLQASKHWTTLIADIRKVFRGELSYSVNFDAFQKGLTTPRVDAVGVDAYFSVPVSDKASVETLTEAWDAWIGRHASGSPEKLILHEVGIAAQNGAYRRPAHWGDTDVPLNLVVQKNWYQAICRTVENNSLGGVYFWSMRIHANPGHEDPKQGDRLSFVDRPAQDVIRDCYGRLGLSQ
jgi:hypothetical protein